MELKMIEIHAPTVQLGKLPARERFTSDGPMHVEALGEYVFVWDDRVEDEVLVFTGSRIKKATMDKNTFLAMMTEPVQNGVAGAASHEPVPAAAVAAVKAGKR